MFIIISGLGTQNTHPKSLQISELHILLPTGHLHLDVSCPKWTSASSSTNWRFLLYFLCILADRLPSIQLSKPRLWEPWSLSLTLIHQILYGFYLFLYGHIMFSLSTLIVTVVSCLYHCSLVGGLLSSPPLSTLYSVLHSEAEVLFLKFRSHFVTLLPRILQ